MGLGKLADDRNVLILRVALITILINVILVIVKFYAGMEAGSHALVSDGWKTCADIVSSIIVMAGITCSVKAPDKEHPYGHERLECIASLLLGIILVGVSIWIGITGFETLFGSMAQTEYVGNFVIITVALSVMVKEIMYWYVKRKAEKVQSEILMADAWHHRVDSISSIGTLAAVTGVRFGYIKCDSIVSIVISLFILGVAYKIIKSSFMKVLDVSVEKEVLVKMTELVIRQDGVECIDEIKTRIFGNRVYVDVEIQADGMLTLNQTHKIAEAVHQAMEKEFPSVKHCMVHVNPFVL